MESEQEVFTSDNTVNFIDTLFRTGDCRRTGIQYRRTFFRTNYFAFLFRIN